MSATRARFQSVCRDIAQGRVDTVSATVAPPWAEVSWVPRELRLAAAGFTWDAPPPTAIRARGLVLSIAAHAAPEVWGSPAVQAVADSLHLFALTTAWAELVTRRGGEWEQPRRAVQCWIERRTAAAPGVGRLEWPYWPLLIAMPGTTAAWTEFMWTWERPLGAVVALSLLHRLQGELKQQVLSEAVSALCHPDGRAEHNLWNAALQNSGFENWAVACTQEMTEPKETLRSLLWLADASTELSVGTIQRAAPLPAPLVVRLAALPIAPDRTSLVRVVKRLMALWCGAAPDAFGRQAIKTQVLLHNGATGILAEHLPGPIFTEIANGCLTFSAAWLYCDVVWPAWLQECARRGCCPSRVPSHAWDCLVVLRTPTTLSPAPFTMAKTILNYRCSYRLQRVRVRFPHLHAPICLYDRLCGERAIQRRARLRPQALLSVRRTKQVLALVYATLNTELPFVPLDLTRIVATIVKTTRGNAGQGATGGVCTCCASKLRWIV